MSITKINLIGKNKIEQRGQEGEEKIINKRCQYNSLLKSTPEIQRKYNTIVHKIIDIEKKDGQEVMDSDYKIFDEIIDEAKVKIETKSEYSRDEAIEILQTINQIINKRDIIYKETDLPISHRLRIGEHNCTSLSYIYYAIGQELKLPIHLVYVPKHVFVRWDADNKHDATKSMDHPINRDDINWETTCSAVSTDDYYIIENDISHQSIQG